MDYHAEIALLEREIEEKYDEIEHLKEKIEKERREETEKFKKFFSTRRIYYRTGRPVRNGHGQDYLDYEANTNPNEISEK